MADLSCAVCAQELRGHQVTRTCPSCAVRIHADCVNLAGACPGAGCDATLGPPSDADDPKPHPVGRRVAILIEELVPFGILLVGYLVLCVAGWVLAARGILLYGVAIGFTVALYPIGLVVWAFTGYVESEADRCPGCRTRIRRSERGRCTGCGAVVHERCVQAHDCAPDNTAAWLAPIPRPEAPSRLYALTVGAYLAPTVNAEGPVRFIYPGMWLAGLLVVLIGVGVNQPQNPYEWARLLAIAAIFPAPTFLMWLFMLMGIYTSKICHSCAERVGTPTPSTCKACEQPIHRECFENPLAADRCRSCAAIAAS